MRGLEFGNEETQDEVGELNLLVAGEQIGRKANNFFAFCFRTVARFPKLALFFSDLAGGKRGFQRLVLTFRRGTASVRCLSGQAQMEEEVWMP